MRCRPCLRPKFTLPRRILQRMRNFVRRNRYGRQRTPVMMLLQKPYGLILRIVVIAFVRDFNFHVGKVEAVEQVARQFPAGAL